MDESKLREAVQLIYGGHVSLDGGVRLVRAAIEEARREALEGADDKLCEALGDWQVCGHEDSWDRADYDNYHRMKAAREAIRALAKPEESKT